MAGVVDACGARIAVCDGWDEYVRGTWGSTQAVLAVEYGGDRPPRKIESDGGTPYLCPFVDSWDVLAADSGSESDSASGSDSSGGEAAAVEDGLESDSDSPET
jgi:hypothetical protein